MFNCALQSISPCFTFVLLAQTYLELKTSIEFTFTRPYSQTKLTFLTIGILLPAWIIFDLISFQNQCLLSCNSSFFSIEFAISVIVAHWYFITSLLTVCFAHSNDFTASLISLSLDSILLKPFLDYIVHCLMIKNNVGLLVCKCKVYASMCACTCVCVCLCL